MLHMSQENVSEESAKVPIEMSLKIEIELRVDKIEVTARISGFGPQQKSGHRRSQG